MGVDKQRLGTLLDEMIRTLSARQHAPMGDVMGRLSEHLGLKPDAVYKWRQGVFVPNADAVAYLVQVGVGEAGMNRAWAEEVVALARHPERSSLIAHLFPASLVPSSALDFIRHNLPHPQHHTLYGREHDLARVYEGLSPDSREGIVPITGPSGIGKTALALEVAWQLIRQETHTPGQTPGQTLAGMFDAAIYASASRRLLDSRGIARRPAVGLQRLDDLYDIVPEMLAPLPLPGSANHEADRGRLILRTLRQVGRVLLVIDDLDALDDDEMRDVLNFLRDLPSNCKALVTARFHEDLPWPIQLRALDSTSLEKVLGDECAARLEPLGRSLTDSQRRRLIEAAAGNPLALKWFLWKMILLNVDAEEATRGDGDFNQPLRDFLDDPYAHRVPTLLRKGSISGQPAASVARGPRSPARQTRPALVGGRKEE